MRVSAAVALSAGALLAMSCGLATPRVDHGAGIRAFAKYGCDSCRTLKEVSGPNGLVGPPLSGVGKRRYIAGELSNTHENLTHWIRHPQAVNPRTAMPELAVTQQDADDIAVLLCSSK